MTTSQKIQAIREKVALANQEVMEPKLYNGFRCLVSSHGERYVTSYDIAISRSAVNDPERFEILEILGRPIRLADVLLASNRRLCACGKEGMLKIDGCLMGENIKWNLRKDSLDAQDEANCRAKMLIHLIENKIVEI